MEELIVHNAWRPVDARWRRAVGIADRGELRAAPRWDGLAGTRWIRRAERFRAAVSGNKTQQGRLEMLIEHQDVFWAHSIQTRTGAKYKRARWALQARILAGETNKEIAKKIGYPHDVVAAYEALFFNVRERLGSRDFILNVVLGLPVDCTPADCSPDVLWQAVGYSYGPHVLDSVMARFPTGRLVNGPVDVAAFFQDILLQSTTRKAAIAALTMPIVNPLPLLNTALKYNKYEQGSHAEGEWPVSLQRTFYELMGTFNYETVGVTEEGQLPEYDRSAAELTTKELHLAATGLKSPDMEFLNNLKYPGQE